MGLDHYYTFSEVISFLQKYKQKTIAHNGDNSTNKTNLIYLDDKNMQKTFYWTEQYQCIHSTNSTNKIVPE